MGKRINYGLVVGIFALCITGIVYGDIMITNSITKDAIKNFEQNDGMIFLNGTITEIQYDFDDDMWLEINGSNYDLGDFFNNNAYNLQEDVSGILNDFYYLLDVNDTLIIYNSGRTLINNKVVITREYLDLDNFEIGLFMTLIFINVGLVAILTVIAGYSIDDIYYSKDKNYYKEKLDKRNQKLKKLIEYNDSLRKEVKELKAIQIQGEILGVQLDMSKMKAIQYCHECGSKIEGKHCSYCGAEVRK
ncbi:hypothetical protein LCGC14_2325870 [marine sediment metagenome]|uniref:Uncharacterized protein n=1 Tax=marine sediment metagenome TaxID=412755 RepID=A0A0F9CGG7_9ZZZZ